MSILELPSALVRHASGWLCWLDRTAFAWTSKSMLVAFTQGPGGKKLIGNEALLEDVKKQLKDLDIIPEYFLDVLRKSEAVLTGDFLLACMLGCDAQFCNTLTVIDIVEVRKKCSRSEKLDFESQCICGEGGFANMITGRDLYHTVSYRYPDKEYGTELLRYVSVRCFYLMIETIGFFKAMPDERKGVDPFFTHFEHNRTIEKRFLYFERNIFNGTRLFVDNWDSLLSRSCNINVPRFRTICRELRFCDLERRIHLDTVVRRFATVGFTVNLIA